MTEELKHMVVCHAIMDSLYLRTCNKYAITTVTTGRLQLVRLSGEQIDYLGSVMNYKEMAVKLLNILIDLIELDQ